MATVKRKIDAGQYQLKDQVVAINRVTKVVKGGKNLSFAALVVVGDPSAKKVFLAGGGFWYEAPDPKGPWTANATPTPAVKAVAMRKVSGE